MKCTGFFVHVCGGVFFKQYNWIVDQSVCGLKGWPWCWACGSVLRMTKDNVTFPQPQPREVADGTMPTRWLSMTGCFHLLDSHYIRVSIIFHFQSILKAGRPETTLFSVKNSKIQAAANSAVSKFQLEKLPKQHWKQAMEWLGKQQHVRCKEKGKKCSPAQSYPVWSIKLQQQVWEPDAKVAVLPCCKPVHTNALLEQWLRLQPC